MSFLTTYKAGDPGHPDLHNTIGHRLNRIVYIRRGEDLPARLTWAAVNGVAAVLEKGTHTINAPLVLEGVTGLHWSGYGSVIRAAADMPVMLRLNGLSGSVIQGVQLTTGTARVDDVVQYVWDGVISPSSSGNLFTKIHVSGNYINGWQIGFNGFQVDNTIWQQCGAMGQWVMGETTLWQRAFKIGDGHWGNVMLLSFVDALTVGHAIQFEISAVPSVSISGSSTQSGLDFLLNTTGPLRIYDYRSEGSAQFMQMGLGAASYGAFVSVTDSHYNFPAWATDFNPNKRWIEMKLGGTLCLRNMRVTGPASAQPLVIYGRPARPAAIDIHGLAIVDTPQGAAFDVDPATTTCAGFFNMDVAGGIYV